MGKGSHLSPSVPPHSRLKTTDHFSSSPKEVQSHHSNPTTNANTSNLKNSSDKLTGMFSVFSSSLATVFSPSNKMPQSDDMTTSPFYQFQLFSLAYENRELLKSSLDDKQNPIKPIEEPIKEIMKEGKQEQEEMEEEEDEESEYEYSENESEDDEEPIQHLQPTPRNEEEELIFESESIEFITWNGPEDELLELIAKDQEDDYNSWMFPIRHDEDYSDLADDLSKPLYNPKRQDLVRRGKQNNKKMVESRHIYVNGPRQAHSLIRQSIIEQQFELKKEKAARKTNGARYNGAFGPLFASVPNAVPSSLKPESTRSNQTRSNDQADRELQAAIEASIREMSRGSQGNFSGNQIELLASLQTRDLTPEDYELLLLLDSTVKPKTLSKSQVDNFPKKEASPEMFQEVCPVCMTNYEESEVVTTLPCGHHFHHACISHWLCNSSVNCPTDGLPVQCK